MRPLAIRAMAESGIDISAARSKTLDEYIGQHFDYVITVCDRANETCPIFPGDPRSFPDPSAAEGTEEDQFRVYRKVRDEILSRLRMWTQLPLKARAEAM
ncbi:hypothetical protein BH23CHL1_BH23CHL1_18240 [soil metagenome]